MIGVLERQLERRLGPELTYAAFRFLCYVSVSAAALVVDVTFYRLALTMFETAAPAAMVGFIFGVLTHYTISSRLAFSDILKTRGGIAEAPVVGRFFLAGLTGLCVTTLIVWMVADVAGYHPYVAKACAVGFSFVSVFTVMRLLVLGNFLKQPSA